MSAGNVSLSAKNLDGSPIRDAVAFRQRLLVAQYRQDDQTTPLDDNLNAITFLGSMLARAEPPTQAWKDAQTRMIQETGAPLIDHVLCNMDLFARRLTWGKELAGAHGWPEKGNRVHPSPGLWMRGSEYGRGPYIGAIASQSMPPVQTPGIDGIPGLTTMATCAHHLTVYRRTIEMGLRFVKVEATTLAQSLAVGNLLGTRFRAREPALWRQTERDERGDPAWWSDRENWVTDAYLPPGLYSVWEAWARDLATGRTGTAHFAFGGYVPTLHPHFGWNYNTEHWTAGSAGHPLCVAVTDVEIARKHPDWMPVQLPRDQYPWGPLPAVHFYRRMEQPNHKPYAGNGAIVISTEPVNLPEMQLGDVIDPRRKV